MWKNIRPVGFLSVGSWFCRDDDDRGVGRRRDGRTWRDQMPSKSEAVSGWKGRSISGIDAEVLRYQLI